VLTPFDEFPTGFFYLGNSRIEVCITFSPEAKVGNSRIYASVVFFRRVLV